MTTAQTERRATALGLGAVGLWAGLAALTALAGAVPPFQLTAMTFALGTLVGIGYAMASGEGLDVLRRVPRGAFLLGVYGLLAFHACYFFALQSAPALEASLIIYLWPLLIVVFSGLLPASAGGRRLTWPHYLGALLGFAGAAQILIGASQDLSLAGAPTGYGLALAAALIWSSYSVASRLYARVPSAAVTAACAATAVGAALLHLALETTVWPATPTEWLAVLGLGLGPTGLAFYIWDEGMKRGDMRLLGVASYATPLLSTLVLWLSGLAAPGGSIWIAAALITAGAFIAGRSAT